MAEESNAEGLYFNKQECSSHFFTVPYSQQISVLQFPLEK